MKKINEIFAEKPKTFSLELFPPKTEEGYGKLLEAIKLFAHLKPDFISCTYGAGGGSREKTLDIVEHIQKEHGIASIAHLTCVMHTQKDIKGILEDIQARKICNVLALRGDSPQDNPDWKPEQKNFAYAYELCDFIHAQFPNFFSVGVAGFPEGHPLCPNKDLDAAYLKKKIDAGADYVITQLFFDNKDYFDYVKELRVLGVNARVIPGIIPITDFQGLLRFCKICGASVPEKVKNIFEPIAGDKEKTLKKGIEFCVAQCRELLEGGAPGVHFYALNKIHPLDAIFLQIKDLL